MIKADVIIIGAGAAGLMAAISASKSKKSVLVIERNDIPGKKLLITGGGRCNITNTNERSDFLKHIFPKPIFFKAAFSQFSNFDLIKFCKNNGLELKNEHSKIYPKSDNAKDVVEFLYSYSIKNQIHFQFNTKAIQLIIKNNSVTGLIVEHQGEIIELFCEKIILCAGGKTYPTTGSDGSGFQLAKRSGHTIIDPTFGLTPLVINDNLLHTIAGITLENIGVECVCKDVNHKRKGNVLFTHKGLSGPAILDISSFLTSGDSINLDLFPDISFETLDKKIIELIDFNGKKKISNILKAFIPISLIEFILSRLELPTNLLSHQLKSTQRKSLIKSLKSLNFTIQAKENQNKAMITIGGIPLDEINQNTMESKICKNLFFAGEIINLHGDTGGYNLQIAFSTGWLAGIM